MFGLNWNRKLSCWKETVCVTVTIFISVITLEVSQGHITWRNVVRMILSAHLTMLEYAVAIGSSVCLSVCLSVTLVIHTYRVRDIKLYFVPFNSVMFLVS